MQQEILKIYEEGVLNSEDGGIPEDILKISKLAQPSSSELTRYKLWLQQKYRSPYTGKMIPLNKLFTPAYEIEHIIPQSRYYDDSFSNKIICESAVNKLKENYTGMEFILNEGGRIIEIDLGEMVEIYKKEDYEKFVTENYSKSRGKMKKLLMEDVPEIFIQRQLNDSRYISKVVKNLMSNIVRQEGEQETVSKNIISSNGSITSALKQDWGLNEVWNELITPRFQRLNELTKSNNFGEWTIKEGKRVFQTQVPLELQPGFSKKRIDHRHHAMDAIVIACATRDHINFLNNESALGKKSREEKEKKRYDLRSKQNYKWLFNKPWGNFTQDIKEVLNAIVVSFKQNQRVINKTVNKYQKWGKEANGETTKQIVKQTKGDSWAIRKPMHKDTVSGLVKLKFSKEVSLNAALDNPELIADKELRKKISELFATGYDKKKLSKYFKELNYEFEGKNISKVEVFYWDVDKDGNGNNAASRVKIDESFNSSMINCITDTGIQKIMLNHLVKYNEVGNSKIIEHPELAFSPDGLDELNKNIRELNDGKWHQAIYKVRTYEPRGNKFSIGQTGNKKHKYVEAAKGTNLFFAIYTDTNGKRSYETIPLNIVIERQKQGLSSVPETNEDGNKLLIQLSPNDLVYVPTEEEIKNSFLHLNNLSKEQSRRIYKFIDSSDSTANFIPSYVSNLIFNVPKKEQEKFGLKYSIQNEFGLGSPQSKNQKSIDEIMIKEFCFKLKIDRLGNISPAR
jgi:CRISPR-associated endonuclease Csn1